MLTKSQANQGHTCGANLGRVMMAHLEQIRDYKTAVQTEKTSQARASQQKVDTPTPKVEIEQRNVAAPVTSQSENTVVQAKPVATSSSKSTYTIAFIMLLLALGVIKWVA